MKDNHKLSRSKAASKRPVRTTRLQIARKERKNTKTLTIEEKLELINDYKKNSINQRDLAEKYEIGQATVSNIIKKKSLYEEQFAQGNAKLKQLKRSGKFSDLNELVFKFVELANSNNAPLSGPMIKTKASQIATEMGLEDFRCSDGWLTAFKRRYNITFGSHSGELASGITGEIDLISASEAKQEKKTLLEAKKAMIILEKFCNQSGFDQNVTIFQAGCKIDELIAKQDLKI